MPRRNTFTPKQALSCSPTVTSFESWWQKDFMKVPQSWKILLHFCQLHVLKGVKQIAILCKTVQNHLPTHAHTTQAFTSFRVVVWKKDWGQPPPPKLQSLRSVMKLWRFSLCCKVVQQLPKGITQSTLRYQTYANNCGKSPWLQEVMRVNVISLMWVKWLLCHMMR